MDKKTLFRVVDFYEYPIVTYPQFVSGIADEFCDKVLWPYPYPFQSRNDTRLHYMFEFP